MALSALEPGSTDPKRKKVKDQEVPPSFGLIGSRSLDLFDK